MDVKRDNLGGGSAGGRRKEWRILRMKKIEVCFIYTYEDSIVKPTKP
jgi:hypothetical protein